MSVASRRPRRLRLSTALLATLAVAATARVGAVWSGFAADGRGATLVADALASDAKPAAHGAKAESTEPGAAAPGPKETCPPPPPPGATFSEAEIAVLQQLSQRRAALEDREREIERRGALVGAVEIRIGEKLQAMQALQGVLEGLIQRRDEQMEARTRSLVKVYELMKPAEAARIFEALDADTLLPVAEKMNERKLAPIMAELDPRKAKEVTERLKNLRELARPPKS